MLFLQMKPSEGMGLLRLCCLCEWDTATALICFSAKYWLLHVQYEKQPHSSIIYTLNMGDLSLRTSLFWNFVWRSQDLYPQQTINSWCLCNKFMTTCKDLFSGDLLLQGRPWLQGLEWNGMKQISERRPNWQKEGQKVQTKRKKTGYVCLLSVALHEVRNVVPYGCFWWGDVINNIPLLVFYQRAQKKDLCSPPSPFSHHPTALTEHP